MIQRVTAREVVTYKPTGVSPLAKSRTMLVLKAAQEFVSATVRKSHSDSQKVSWKRGDGGDAVTPSSWRGNV
jgi:hypothetical protein